MQAHIRTHSGAIFTHNNEYIDVVTRLNVYAAAQVYRSVRCKKVDGISHKHFTETKSVYNFNMYFKDKCGNLFQTILIF